MNPCAWPPATESTTQMHLVTLSMQASYEILCLTSVTGISVKQNYINFTLKPSKQLSAALQTLGLCTWCWSICIIAVRMQYNVLVYRKLGSLNKGTDISKFQYLITEGTYIHRVQAKYTAVQKQPSRYHSTDKATARVNCLTSLCLQTDLLPIPSALDLQHHCWWKMAVWPTTKRTTCNSLHDIVSIKLPQLQSAAMKPKLQYCCCCS